MIHQENGRSFRSSSIACAIPLFRTLFAAWCSRDRNAFPVVSLPLPAMALWPACHRRRHGNGHAALRAKLSLEQYSVPSETPPITIPTGSCLIGAAAWTRLQRWSRTSSYAGKVGGAQLQRFADRTNLGWGKNVKV